jgi:hypothetical protein
MKQYLLSIYQPDGPPPRPEDLGPVMENMAALIEQAKAAGVFVASGGLHAAASAAVVQRRRGETLVTDGPFVESKEHLGGFLIVRMENFDGALEWAGKLARVLTLDGPGAPEAGLPIEVRLFEHLIVER